MVTVSNAIFPLKFHFLSFLFNTLNLGICLQFSASFSGFYFNVYVSYARSYSNLCFYPHSGGS
jgi:hypothetical protein